MMRKTWIQQGCAALLWGATTAAAWAVTVSEVRVVHDGPGPLDASSVQAFISVQAGDAYAPGAVSRDLRTLQATERFSHVTTRVEPVGDGEEIAVIYVVRHKPRIRSLTINGADHISNRKVRDLLELSVGDMVDDTTVAVRAQNVYEHYQKRYFLSPRLTWDIDVDQEAGGADVRIEVKEGQRAGIWRIHFDGNESVRNRPLRRSMEQGSWRPWSWITKGNRYDPFVLDMDRDNIRAVYQNHGFLDIQVDEPVIEPVRSKLIRVTMPLEEGPLYTVGEVDVEGVEIFPEEEVRRILRLQPGDIASAAALEQNRQNLRDFYGSRGYIGTHSTFDLVETESDDFTSVVDVTFRLREGELAHIRDIRVRGNTRTKDKVIRRELAILPGDIYDEVRVRRSENRLRNMGYFTQVRAYPDPTPEEDVYDVTFEVDEARTGQLMAGVAFSSIDNLVGFAEIGQNNFDLFGAKNGFTGGGQKIKLRTQVGSRRTDVDLSFVEPWFLDRQLSLEVDLFRSDKRFLSRDYDQRNVGGSVGLSRAVGRFTRARVAYGLEEISIRNVSDSASDIIREEEGTRSKSFMTLSLTRDTRDNFFIPTRGNRSVLLGSLAGGPFQGDTDIYLLEARSSQYYPLWFDHVFSLRGRAAVVERYGDSDRVPIFDRLFLGGARDVRGFRFRDVGPRDELGEPIGGKTSAFLSAEYTIPVVTNIRLAGFYDIGMVWEDAYDVDLDTLNSAAGIGVRFDIPGFPLRFDYAWPLESDEFNDRRSGRFSFMIGYVL